jgi:L-histidine Nalpha-methyltransferase
MMSASSSVPRQEGLPLPLAGEGGGEGETDAHSEFAADVLEGLSRPNKAIPSRWLYDASDARGSELFERITRLDAYYPARTETWILERSAAQIGAAAGAGATLIELGARASANTQLLLEALDRPAAYVPIDSAARLLAPIAALQLLALQQRFAPMPVLPIAADFSRIAELPALAQLTARRAQGRHIVYLSGAAIGSFTPEAAVALLQRIGRGVGRDALLVIGTDTTHDPALLMPAYDDGEGACAEFNKNLLWRINRELGADFDVDAFDHRAHFDARGQRIEMQLVSRREQRVRVLDQSFHFDAGECLRTASAYQYGFFKFHAVARHALWAHRQFWTDAHARFAVHVLERAA